MVNKYQRKASKPSDYKYIRAWGTLLGSFSNYIDRQQSKAFEDDSSPV